MLEIIFTVADLPKAADHGAILVTSANAVAALSSHQTATEWRSLPIYTVGARTAEAADRHGWSEIRSAEGNADDLAALVIDRLTGSPTPVLYACGTDRAGDLETRLRDSGVPVTLAEVYRARMIETFPEPVSREIRKGAIDLVMLYSARSAEAFVRALERESLLAEARLMAFGVLSEAVAGPLHALQGTSVAIAAQPTETALLRELGLDAGR